jgi:DNA-binding Xre family transcriptional regulator
LRVRAALSQRGLAEQAGIDKTTVEALEGGRAPGINLHTLSALAQALKVQIGVLLGEQPGPAVDATYWRQIRREIEAQIEAQQEVA